MKFRSVSLNLNLNPSPSTSTADSSVALPTYFGDLYGSRPQTPRTRTDTNTSEAGSLQSTTEISIPVPKKHVKLPDEPRRPALSILSVQSLQDPQKRKSIWDMERGPKIEYEEPESNTSALKNFILDHRYKLLIFLICLSVFIFLLVILLKEFVHSL
ncbi:unnamed protein product, partial [Mesorhabditis spiculigera]